MVAIGAGSRQRVAYIVEATRGTAPATPAMQLARFNDFNLDLKKETFKSDEHRSDRQTTSIRHGMRTVDGSIEAEVSVSGHDALYEGAFAGAFTAGTSVTLSGATSTGNKLTRAANSFITDGYLVGDLVTIAGFVTQTGNNGTARITEVSALYLVLDITGPYAKTLVTESIAATVILKGKKLKAGTTLSTYTFEEMFSDLGVFRTFTGVAINDLTLTLAPKAMAKVSFGCIGMDSSLMAAQTAAGPPQVGITGATYTVAATNEPLDAYQAGLYEGGTLNALVTSATIKLGNGRTTDGVVGSATTPDIFEGRTDISGTLSLFFTTITAYNKFRDETASSLDIILQDRNGTDFLRFCVPALKLNTGGMEVPLEGPITVTQDFAGYYDPTAGTSFYMQRSNS